VGAAAARRGGLWSRVLLLGLIGFGSLLAYWLHVRWSLNEREWSDYLRAMHLAESYASGPRINLAHEELDAWRTSNLRGWEWDYLKRLCSLEAVKLVGHEAEVVCLAYSPDGNRLATGDEQGQVILWDAAGGNCSPVAAHGGRVSGVCFSAEGRLLITSGESFEKARVYDVRRASASWRPTRRQAGGRQPAGQPGCHG
jgi:WD40 repeat protein